MVGVKTWEDDQIVFILTCKEQGKTVSEIIDLVKERWPRKIVRDSGVRYVLSNYKDFLQNGNQTMSGTQSNQGHASQKRAQAKQPRSTSTRTGPQGLNLGSQSSQSPTAAAPAFLLTDTFKLAPQMREISGGPIHSSFDNPQPFHLLNDGVQSRTQLLAHAEQAQDLGMYAIQRGQQVPAPSPGGQSIISSPAAPQPFVTSHQGHAVNQAGLQSPDNQRWMSMPPMDMYNNPYGAMNPPNLQATGQQQFQTSPAYHGLPGPQGFGGQTPKLPGYVQSVPFQQGQIAGAVPNGVANMSFHGNVGMDYGQPFEHHQQSGMPPPAYPHHMQYHGLPTNHGALAVSTTNGQFNSQMLSGQFPNTLYNGQQRTGPSPMQRSASRMSSIDPQLISASQYMPPVIDQQASMNAARPPTRNGVTATPQEHHAPQFLRQPSQNGVTSKTISTAATATPNGTSATSQPSFAPRMMAPMAQQSQYGATATPRVSGPANMASQKARNGVTTTPQLNNAPQLMAPVTQQSQKRAVVTSGVRNPDIMTTQEIRNAPAPTIKAENRQPQDRPTITPQVHLPGKPITQETNNGPTKTTQTNNISQAAPQYTTNKASATPRANPTQSAIDPTPHNGSFATPHNKLTVDMESQTRHNGTTSWSNPATYPTQPALKRITITMTRPVFETPFSFPTSSDGWNVVFKEQEERTGVGQGEGFYARVSKGNFDIILKNPIFREGVIWNDAPTLSSTSVNGVPDIPAPVLPTQIATPSNSSDTPGAGPARCSPNPDLSTPKMTASPPLSNLKTPANSNLSATELAAPSTSREIPVVEEAQSIPKQDLKTSQVPEPPSLTHPKPPSISPLSPKATESAFTPAPEISVPRPIIEPESLAVSPPSPQLLDSHFRKNFSRDPWKRTGPAKKTMTPYLLEMKARLAAGEDISSSSPQKRAALTTEQEVSPSKRQRTSSHTSLTASPQNGSTMNAQNLSAAQDASTSNPKKRAAPSIEQEASSSKRQKTSIHDSLATSPQNPSTMSAENISDAQNISNMQSSLNTSSIEPHTSGTIRYANGQAEFTSLSHTSRPEFEEFLKQLPTANPSLTLPSDPSSRRHGSQNSSSQILQPEPSRPMKKGSSILLSPEVKLRQYSADVARQQQEQGPILPGHAPTSSTNEGISAGMLLDMPELPDIPDGFPAQEASLQQEIQSGSIISNSDQHQGYAHPATLLDGPAADTKEVQEDELGAADVAKPEDSWAAELDALFNEQPDWGQIKVEKKVERVYTGPKFSGVRREGIPPSPSPPAIKYDWEELKANYFASLEPREDPAPDPSAVPKGYIPPGLDLESFFNPKLDPSIPTPPRFQVPYSSREWDHMDPSYMVETPSGKFRRGTHRNYVNTPWGRYYPFVNMALRHGRFINKDGSVMTNEERDAMWDERMPGDYY